VEFKKKMNTPIDFPDAVIALIAAFTGHTVATYVGPYAVIFLFACLGAAVRLSYKDEDTENINAVRFVTLRICIAVMVGVTCAELLELVVSAAKPKYTVAPLAFVIGWIKDYRAVFNWFAEVVKGFVGKRYG
jgi:hypothetical protein